MLLKDEKQGYQPNWYQSCRFPCLRLTKTTCCITSWLLSALTFANCVQITCARPCGQRNADVKDACIHDTLARSGSVAIAWRHRYRTCVNNMDIIEPCVSERRPGKKQKQSINRSLARSCSMRDALALCVHYFLTPCPQIPRQTLQATTATGGGECRRVHEILHFPHSGRKL